MEIVGTIKTILETEVISDKFSKAGAVVETNEKFPQTILVEFVNDNIALLDKYAVGDLVLIKVNVRGREWTSPQGDTRYFVSLQGWAIGLASSESNVYQGKANTKHWSGLNGEIAQASVDDELSREMEDDDLPF